MALTTSPQPTSAEDSEAMSQIRRQLEELTATIVQNPVLAAIENGTLSQEQWRQFARQRYRASRHFVGLLEATIQAAQANGAIELARVAAANLRDERGINTQGEPLAIGSHEEWRRDFYAAIGLNEEKLINTRPFPGTQQYAETLQHIIDTKDAWTMAGALLLLEYSIPKEFEYIKTGRDKTFPTEFVITDNDTPEQRRQKNRIRLYIDHHIAHDRHSHYPELEIALMPHIDEPTRQSKIMEGMNQIAAAKQKFYASLEQNL